MIYKPSLIKILVIAVTNKCIKNAFNSQLHIDGKCLGLFGLKAVEFQTVMFMNERKYKKSVKNYFLFNIKGNILEFNKQGWLFCYKSSDTRSNSNKMKKATHNYDFLFPFCKWKAFKLT